MCKLRGKKEHFCSSTYLKNVSSLKSVEKILRAALEPTMACAAEGGRGGVKNVGKAPR